MVGFCTSLIPGRCAKPPRIDTDETGAGLSMVFADWRFKLQVSDALSVCLCVESRGDSQFMQVKTAELLANISGTEERP